MSIDLGRSAARRLNHQKGIRMLRNVAPIAVILSFTLGTTAQDPGSHAPRIVKPLQPLLVALDRAKVSGSLELSGLCDTTRWVPFHSPHWQPAASNGSPIEVAREILAGNPAIRITQDPDGTIRMTDPGVPTDLLNTKIKHISFESNGKPLEYGAFTANEAAIRVILRAPEIVAFVKDHDIQYPTGNGEGGSWVLGAKRVLAPPNMSGYMDDLTLSEALDRVLRTFGGIWIYEDCPATSDQKRTSFFRFANLKEEFLIEK
jgi:hypothetical protein